MIGDAFLFKVAADGSRLVFSTYLGGTGEEYGDGIAVDPTANLVYVAGETQNDFPTTSGAIATTRANCEFGRLWSARLPTTPAATTTTAPNSAGRTAMRKRSRAFVERSRWTRAT